MMKARRGSRYQGSGRWDRINKYMRVPRPVRRGGLYSIFVIILVVSVVMVGSIGGEFMVNAFRGIIPWSTTNLSEEGSGKVYFEVSPAYFAKYWRIGVYDMYKNGSWVRTLSGYRDYTGGYIDTGVKKYLTVQGYTLQVKLVSALDVIPTVLNTVRVELEDGSGSPLRIDDYGVITPPTGFRGSYRITYLDYSYSTAMLGNPVLDVPSEMIRYLSLSGVDPDLIAYARNQVRGIPAPFEKMMFLTTQIKHRCTFSLNFSHPPDKDPIAYFLLESRKGGIREFASALALAARSAGIPTRLVSGFVLGDVKDTTRVLTEENLHYWVEAYFGDLGWIPFEPSPGAGSLGIVSGYDPGVRGGGNGGPRMRVTDSLADLAPVSPYSMPENLHPNTPFTIYLQINNYGERIVNWFEFGIETNYDVMIRSVEMTIYPYEEVIIPVVVTLVTSGPQSGRIIVDPEDKLPESNEGNNLVVVFFDVISGIDLHIQIDRASIWNGKVPYREDVIACIRVTNLGDLNAYLVTVKIQYGSTFVRFINITTVMGGSSVEVNFRLPVMPEGVYNLSAVVDPFSTIPEFNETNNQDQALLKIVPRFEVLAVTWVDETGDAEFGPGDKILVTIRSNLFSGRQSKVRVMEVDPHGEVMVDTTLTGGSDTTVPLVIDHMIPDITEAEVVVEEL